MGATNTDGQAPDPGRVTLPPGVTLGAGRETSQTNQLGQVVQGMVFPLQMPNGTITSVFLSYAQLENVPQAQAVFDQRIRALQAITG